MVNNLYDFWKKDLADVYLEATKPVMKSDRPESKAAALNTLYICLDAALKMLHPTMPYLTEASVTDPLYRLILRRQAEDYWSSWRMIRESNRKKSS